MLGLSQTYTYFVKGPSGLLKVKSGDAEGISGVSFTTEQATNLADGASKFTPTEVDNIRAGKKIDGTAMPPSTAQKNSDITKAEIEAKLIGTITSHDHTGMYLGATSTAADTLKIAGHEVYIQPTAPTGTIPDGTIWLDTSVVGS